MCFSLANKKVLVPTTTHRSAYSGLQLVGADILQVIPERDEKFDVIEALSLDQIKKTLQEHPDIEALFLTTPTPQGDTIDIQKVREIAGDRLIMVDESHGAHFYFSPKFPSPSIKSGADLAVISADKTLGG